MDVTPTWWEWRQQQAEGLALDYDQMLAMVAESKERQDRFVALFRRLPGDDAVTTTS